MSLGPRDIDPRDVEGVKRLQELYEHALERAELRQELLDHPNEVLARDEYGLTVPPGVEVIVHKNTPQTLHLVLPMSPEAGVELTLDETDLGVISWFCPGI